MATYTLDYFKNLYEETSNYLMNHGFNPLPIIPIFIEYRGRNLMGCVSYTTEETKVTVHNLTINSRILKDSSYTEDDIKETFYHEIAHVYCLYYYGKNGRGHGPLFNRVAKALGSYGGKYHQSSEKAVKAFERREEQAASFTVKTFTAKDIHSMRCSFKLMARKYNMELTAENFNKYVRPRYINIYTKEQIDEALAKIVC